MYLNWDEYEAWGPRCEAWLLGYSSDAALVSAAKVGVVGEWIQAIDRQTSLERGLPTSVAEEFLAWCRTEFLGVVIVHATRLKEVSQILAEGLRAWSAPELADYARREVGHSYDEYRVLSAVRDARADHRGGKVYSFSCLSHALGLERGAQAGRIPEFALLGSEFIRAFRANLGLAEMTEPLPGRAFLIECGVRWNLLAASRQVDVGMAALQAAFHSMFPSEDNISYPGFEYVSVEADLSPDAILRYADVEHLIECVGIATSEIQWQDHERSLGRAPG